MIWIWFHDMNSYMNSWYEYEWIWIHDMNMNSWYEFINEFMIWIHKWIHCYEKYRETICHTNKVSIRIYEFIYEFMLLNSWWRNHIWNQIVNSCVNSVLSSLLWRILWNYGWNPSNEFTYAIMVEFIDLELIQIQLRICCSEGKCFTHPK